MSNSIKLIQFDRNSTCELVVEFLPHVRLVLSHYSAEMRHRFKCRIFCCVESNTNEKPSRIFFRHIGYTAVSTLPVKCGCQSCLLFEQLGTCIRRHLYLVSTFRVRCFGIVFTACSLVQLFALWTASELEPNLIWRDVARN